MTVLRGATCWNSQFNATMPSSVLLHRAPERAEVAGTEVPVHAEKTKTSRVTFIKSLFESGSGHPVICLYSMFRQRVSRSYHEVVYSNPVERYTHSVFTIVSVK